MNKEEIEQFCIEMVEGGRLRPELNDRATGFVFECSHNIFLGWKLSRDRRCNCGHRNTVDNFKYCPYCGGKILTT